eukprot:1844834-Amphidinium_carterae.1
MRSRTWPQPKASWLEYSKETPENLEPSTSLEATCAPQPRRFHPKKAVQIDPNRAPDQTKSWDWHSRALILKCATATFPARALNPVLNTSFGWRRE